MVSHSAHFRNDSRLTLLQKLESNSNLALIALEQEATIKNSLVVLLLNWGDLGSEWDSTAKNASFLGYGWIGEVTARIGFADVCCERAAVLGGRVEEEMIVLGGVGAESRIIVEGSNVDGRTCGGQLVVESLRVEENRNLPLFHLPIRRAPRRSFGAFGGLLASTNAWNSGTFWER